MQIQLGDEALLKAAENLDESSKIAILVVLVGLPRGDALSAKMELSMPIPAKLLIAHRTHVPAKHERSTTQSQKNTPILRSEFVRSRRS